MAIAFATETGGFVKIFDDRGHALSFPSVAVADGVVGWSETTVSVRNGAFIDTYNEGGQKVGVSPATPARSLRGIERSADAVDPPEGEFAVWQSDGTATGADGDILIKVTAGGVTRTKTLLDYTNPTAAVTATADGLTTGLIVAGTTYVTITSAGANNIATLPSAVAALIGTSIRGYIGDTGCELRTPDASGATINNLDSDGSAEAAIPAETMFEVTCVAVDTWKLRAWSRLGAVLTAIIPD